MTALINNTSKQQHRERVDIFHELLNHADSHGLFSWYTVEFH
jgi:hypothetical protein